MEFLQELLENTEAPLFYAMVLGLLTAISPCQLARNITAVSYIGRDIRNTKRVFLNGLFYTLGNASGYFLIGLILFLGASKFQISKVLVSGGNLMTGLLLLIIGILMLDILKLFPSSGWFSKFIQKREYKGTKTDSMLLGFFFALSFCPYNAALFFGMLIPLTISSPWGLYLPAVYSVACGLPVIFIAYILAFSISGIGNFYNRIKTFQVWINRFVAVIFIISGIYFLYLYILQLIV